MYDYTETGTLVPLINVINAAKTLISQGYAVTPVISKTKKGKLKDWPNKIIHDSEIEQFISPDDNLAIILGAKSGGLTDVDFDHPLVKCFSEFLPETGMIHGRPGNQKSHYWYRTTSPVKYKKFVGLDGEVLVELRSDGHMTMVPPSIHPDGDQLQWVKQGTPGVVDAAVLVAKVSMIAAGALLANHWPKKGSRNDAALALAGTLLRGGWSVPDTAKFICQVAKAAGDEEHEVRGDCASATASKLKADEPVTGLPKLSSIMGAGVSIIVEWLCLDKTPLANDQIGTLIETMNKRHAVVSLGGSMWILNEEIDPTTKRPDVSFSRPSDLRLRYQNRKIVAVSCVSKVISDVWLEHPSRREFSGVEFSPDFPTPGYYNLFQGFAVDAVPGDCSLYLAHVENNICNGNQIQFNYVISWMAHAIQRPGELPGTALVLRGAQGVGKGVFVDNFGKLFGLHYFTLYQLGQVTGRFNGHLKNLLVVHANEAVWGGNKGAEGALKGLVTDPIMPIEAKGKDIISVRNCKRLICSSNEQWAVPLDLDDRRFLILDVSSAHKEDHAYFGAIAKQMADGGWSALMHHLINRDLSGFNVRKLPASSMSFDLKLLSASPTTVWWYEELLDETNFCGGVIEKSMVYESYANWCAKHKKSHFSTLGIFCKELKKLVPNLASEKHKVGSTILPWAGGDRKSYYKFPPRDVCRTHFEVQAKSGPEIWED